MKKVKLVLVCVLFFTSMSICAQQLNIYNLKKGEIYYAEYDYGGTGSCNKFILEYDGICTLSTGDEALKGERLYLYGSCGQLLNNNDSRPSYVGNYCSNNIRGVQHLFKIRHATQEEKDWLNACIEAGKFIPKEEALKSISKNRGQVKSEAIHLSANDRLQPGFKGRKDGFGFAGVSFNYQFVNCGGEVQMGVNIYTKHEYKVNGQTYNRGLTINGYAFEGKLYPTFTVDANQVEILEVEADLYFGSVRLGKVNLDNIVGNFAGCFGETFLVIEQLGLDPKKKEYLENLDKFELKKIRVLRGDVKISEKKRQEIHHNFKYDEWGNLRNPNNKPKEKSEQKYDAFGNPININSPNQNQPKTDPKQNTKYDAFGNPIKN